MKQWEYVVFEFENHRSINTKNLKAYSNNGLYPIEEWSNLKIYFEAEWNNIDPGHIWFKIILYLDSTITAFLAG